MYRFSATRLGKGKQTKMSTKRVEEYAYHHSLSNNAAKKRLGKRRGDAVIHVNITRGAPIAGTGKPKGASK